MQSLCCVWLLYMYVTRSAKTLHNHASLNLQYKLMITMYTCIFRRKKIVKFVNAFYLVKKGSSGKNLDIILFIYSRGTQKLLFSCSGLKDAWVMAVCLRHVETIVHYRFFFTDFVSMHGEDKGKTCPIIDAPFCGKHDGASYNAMWHSIRKLRTFL